MDLKINIMNKDMQTMGGGQFSFFKTTDLYTDFIKKSMIIKLIQEIL